MDSRCCRPPDIRSAGRSRSSSTSSHSPARVSASRTGASSAERLTRRDPCSASAPPGSARSSRPAPGQGRAEHRPRSAGSAAAASADPSEPLRSASDPVDHPVEEEDEHQQQVVATDAGGQETTSRPADLRVDLTKPRVRVNRFRNRLVQVTVSDPTAGVENTSVRVSWGDGKRSSARRIAAHRYRGGGPFRVTVTARDKAGNRATVRQNVRPA
jgi:hypothetical protein